jgi:nicotinic acid mononucleotide adenylyltransferase
MGADSFAGFRRWHRAAEIPFVAPLIVASRPGQPLDLKAALPEGLEIVFPPQPGAKTAEVELHSLILRNTEGALAPLYLLPRLEFPISASEIREQMRMEEPVCAATGGLRLEGALLPASVANYIQIHSLYH